MARASSLSLLVVFALINLALWKIQRNPDLPLAGFSVPWWIPVAGFSASVAFLGYQLFAGESWHKKSGIHWCMPPA